MRDDWMHIRRLVERDDEIIADACSLGEAWPEIVLIASSRKVEREGHRVVGQVKGQLSCVLVAVGGEPSATREQPPCVAARVTPLASSLHPAERATGSLRGGMGRMSNAAWK